MNLNCDLNDSESIDASKQRELLVQRLEGRNGHSRLKEKKVNSKSSEGERNVYVEIYFVVEAG